MATAADLDPSAQLHCLTGTSGIWYFSSVSIRLIAGEFRGRRLQAGPGPAIRPTADRVKESVFALLDARGAVRGARVADLCAGAGGLGLEALSRGARSVVFVERARPALALLQQNLAHLGLAHDPRIRTLRGDACRTIASGALGSVDLILSDPPYDDHAGPALLEAVAGAASLTPGGWMLVEHGRDETFADAYGHLERDSTRAYGKTVVEVYTRRRPFADALPATDG